MDEKVRKILGGMSAASLILAGSLPLMGQVLKGNRTQKTETKEGAEKSGPTKGKATPEKAKTADPPDSGTNKAMNKTDKPPAKTAVKENAAAKR